MFLIPIANKNKTRVHQSSTWLGLQGVFGFLYFFSKDKCLVISTPHYHYFFFDMKFKKFYSLLKKKIEKKLLDISYGTSIKLKLVGVGYKIEEDSVKKELILKLGFSHEIKVKKLKGIQFKRFTERSSIYIFSFVDLQLLKNFTTKIRKFRPIEPYKGKGLRYLTEILKRKEGKKSNL